MTVHDSGSIDGRFEVGDQIQFSPDDSYTVVQAAYPYGRSFLLRCIDQNGDMYMMIGFYYADIGSAITTIVSIGERADVTNLNRSGCPTTTWRQA